ncbi:hypothetical protein EYF80_048012 [Liparis tanakae]|uniref:Uncharacterized protein n=1 Tax=Liparis tanakae TaxID=230148 RepID=A0A4Z2FM13_9TELE|nr:hypothetical protein EYF80_048012 [Liparis tanakae]
MLDALRGPLEEGVGAAPQQRHQQETQQLRWRRNNHSHPVAPGRRPAVTPSRRYVFPIDGASLWVVVEDSLMVLSCSMGGPSALVSDALGGGETISEAALELKTAPDAESGPMRFSGTPPLTVVSEDLGRGLEPRLAPSTLETCVRLAENTKQHVASVLGSKV